MLAVLYLLAIVVVGDTLVRPILAAGRPHLPLPGRPRRLATAFLAGFLALTWLSYGIAYLLRDRGDALGIADLVVLAMAGLVLVVRLAWAVARGGWQAARRPGGSLARPDRSEALDWLVVLAFGVFAGWMMTRTYSMSDGALSIAGIVWSDFGPTSAIAQSFALGHNFPTEYPHFPGLPILYHFLYYFAVGNLTRLGLDPALAGNVLSTVTMVSMLILVMAMGRVLFRSAAVGRIGAALFFVHGSLAWYPYLTGFPTAEAALADIWARTGPLVSGFPYRGEEWGIWTQGTFLNQRHLAGAIGILLLGVLFVVERQLASRAGREVEAEDTTPDPGPAAGGVLVARGRAVGHALDRLAIEYQDRTGRPLHHIVGGLLDHQLLGYVLVGFLLGMLPMWNSAVFLAAAAVFAVLFVLLPNRTQMLAVAIAAGSVALPQLLALRPPDMAALGDYPAIHLGYTVDDPTPLAVTAYLGFTFGPKLLLALVAIIGASWLQGAVFIAFTALVGVAFGLQFSPEVFANHKFLNIWLIAVNFFAAAGIVRLWRDGGFRLPGLTAVVGRGLSRALVLALAGVIAVGGLIDLMPVKNASAISIRLQGDRLFDWLLAETRPDEVFLTDLYVTHPILLAGRKVYYGWPYYAWSAGYPVGPREDAYKQILGATDPAAVVALLQREGIAYVAIDDGMRGRNFVPFLNEPLFAASLDTVFSDPDNRYAHLAIYRVPAGLVPADGAVIPGPQPPPVSMLTGGRGSGPGQFLDPKGIAALSNGEVLVADSGNHRLQRFAFDGTFIVGLGGKGNQAGRFDQPSGVAADSRGRIYVADTANHRLVELEPSGTFASAWSGPAPGFYGPRDVAVGPDDSVYVLDQGRARVVRRDPDGRVTTFGSFGSGPGQLNDPSGLAVAADLVYVADPTNARIQVFGTDGQFVRSIPLPQWSNRTPNADVVAAPDGRQLYASSPATNAVVVIALAAGTGGVLAPPGGEALAGPGALAIRPDGQILVVSLDQPRVSILPRPGP